MSIRDYLAHRNLSVTAFAQQVGVGRVVVHRWMNGALVPSLQSAARIVEVTGGEVTYEDLLPARADATPANVGTDGAASTPAVSDDSAA